MAECFDGLTFSFDGKPSELFGLYMGWRDAGEDWETGLTREIIHGETNIIRHIANGYGAKYTEPLKLSFDIYHKDGSAFSYKESRAINNWLIQDDYKRFKVNDNNTDNIYYRVMCTSIQDITMGTFRGKHIEMTCDSSFAYSNESVKIIDMTTSNSARWNVNNTSDAGIYYPDITIICASDYEGMVSFENVTEERTMNIDMTNVPFDDKKILHIDAKHMQMTDYAGNLVPLYKVGWQILPDVNSAVQSNDLYWLRLVPGINRVDLTGNAKIKFVASFPRKAGQLSE